MNCQDARELFSGRVDGEQSAEERAELDAHLAGCAECRRELARFEGTVALLRGVPPARAPVGFVDRVVAAARPVPWPARLRRRLVEPLAWGQPIAATVGILIAVTAVYLYEKSPELQQAARPTMSYPTAGQAGRQDALEAGAKAKTAPAPLPSARPQTPPSPESRLEGSLDAPGAVAKKEAELRDQPRQVERYATADETKAGRPAESAAPSGGSVAPSPPAVEAPAPAARSAPSAARERQAGAPGDFEKGAFGRTGAANLAAKTAAVDVGGRLAVADRPAAERALAELLARLGVAEVGRYAETDTLVVDVVVPGSAYAQLAEGLARIGRWQPERVPAELPSQVRVSVRIVTGSP